MTVWSPAQVERFLRVAREDRLYALYYLALTTGLRQGELFALKWENVVEGVLRVQYTIRESKDTEEGYQLNSPKTKAGRRSVKLPAQAVEVLKAHRDRIKQEGHDVPWVFCNTRGKPLCRANVIQRSFDRLIRLAEVPKIRFHDLRHTAATLLLLLNINPKIVQERLGHSKINITLDTYSHVLPSMQDDAADQVNGMFESFDL